MKVTVAAILIIAALIYNAYISAINIKGYYQGSAITDSAQEISIYFSTTGDGIFTGDWRSYSDLRKGIITSRTHLFQERSFLLNVNSGKCIGEFPIKLNIEGPNLKVFVDTSAAPHCPASAYSFQLKESEKPTDPNLLKMPVSNAFVLRIAKLGSILVRYSGIWSALDRGISSNPSRDSSQDYQEPHKCAGNPRQA